MKNWMAVRGSCAGFCLLALLVAGGCSLGRGAPAPQHFILGGRTPAAVQAIPRPALDGMSVGVRRLQLASYLGSSFMVVRRGDQEVTFSEFNRWGEPLDAGITRAIAGYLTAGARFGGVHVAPWPVRTEHDYLIELNVLRFEGLAPADPGVSAGEVHVLAEWRILRPGDTVAALRGTTDFRQGGWKVGDHDELAALLDAGLQALSSDLMTGLASLGE